MKITILVGLPASGKTTYGNTLGGVFVDDISMNNSVNKLNLAIKTFEENIVVSDVNLCRESERAKCKIWLDTNAKAYEQEWIYFSNNPEACLKNEKQRKLDGDSRVVTGLIKSLSKEYVIPDGAKIIGCYQ
jgi:hypothetical protein